MIIPDVNLLLYAVISGFAEHSASRRWLEQCINGHSEVGLSSPALFGFIRISTNPRIFDSPLPVDKAVQTIDEWFSFPNVRFLLPGPRHLDIAFRLLRQL